MAAELIRRWLAEVIGEWDMDALIALTSEDIRFVDRDGRERRGREKLMAMLGAMHAALPELSGELVDQSGGFARVRYTAGELAYDGLLHVEGDGEVITGLWGLDCRPHPTEPKPAIPDQRVTPTLRSTDWERSRGFWVDQVGFAVGFEWRHAPGFPIYAGLIRDGAMVHISEHSGDAEIGGHVSIRVDDIDALWRELSGRGLETPEPISQAWDRRELALCDPDGNKLIFFQSIG